MVCKSPTRINIVAFIDHCCGCGCLVAAVAVVVVVVVVDVVVAVVVVAGGAGSASANSSNTVQTLFTISCNQAGKQWSNEALSQQQQQHSNSSQ